MFAQLILFPPFRSFADRGNDTLLTIGATPMLRAAKAGDIVAMKLLMQDRQGRTPVDSAMGRAGGNGFGGNRIDVHADTAALLEQLRVP